MVSSFSWLDYSERDRRKMLDVIDLFGQKETRDELGVGVVRDALADLLFPGTSTIQTRVRYFLFVPWIYRDLERRRISSSRAPAEARDREVALTEAILPSGDSAGVFGRLSRGKLKRLPSSVYWQGLGTWGIRLFPGSQSQYHRSLDGFHESTGPGAVTDAGEPTDDPKSPNWHPGLPQAPPELFTLSSFALTEQEAEYLKERILSRIPGTMLAFLIDRGRRTDDTGFPWEHPQFGDFPGAVRDQLYHAQNFSEAIHGAPLLYNRMLAEAQAHDELADWYRTRLDDWSEKLRYRASELARWDRVEFWATVHSGGSRVAPPARAFIDRWLDIVLGSELEEVLDVGSQARSLISDRELALKGGLARLHNQSALETWNEAAGIDQIDYRWPSARVLVDDILGGLERVQDA